jgi:hypothetical protein
MVGACIAGHGTGAATLALWAFVPILVASASFLVFFDNGNKKEKEAALALPYGTKKG